MQQGLLALLRRARPRQSRRRFSLLLSCAFVAGLSVPMTALTAPSPDPPPSSSHGGGPTSLQPDARPTAPPPQTSPTASRPLETPAQPRVAQTTVERVTAPPPPPDPPVMTMTTSPPETTEQSPAPASKPRARPVGRPFADSQKPARRPPPVEVERPRPRVTQWLVSSDRDSRPYLAAALSLAVLVLGSATLLTVLTRLRPMRRRWA